jgi:formylglycine-generating enzyme required for sulfatase activity
MRFISLALLVLFNIHFVFSQDKNEIKIKSGYLLSVPNQDILIDAYEISNAEWMSYIYNSFYDEETQLLKEDFRKVWPDTTILSEKYRYIFRLFQRHTISPYEDIWKQLKQKTFFGHNSLTFGTIPLLKEELKLKDSLNYANLLELPIAGISMQQVNNYLIWRETITKKNNLTALQNYEITCRLIHPKEWISLSDKVGPRLKTNTSKIIDTIGTQGCYVLNIKPSINCKGREGGLKKYGSGTFGVNSYWPDNYGIYQLFGNVSEMTSEEGVSVGGSYLNYGAECFPDKIITYKKPEPWLGFRCIIEYTKK